MDGVPCVNHSIHRIQMWKQLYTFYWNTLWITDHSLQNLSCFPPNLERYSCSLYFCFKIILEFKIMRFCFYFSSTTRNRPHLWPDAIYIHRNKVQPRFICNHLKQKDYFLQVKLKHPKQEGEGDWGQILIFKKIDQDDCLLWSHNNQRRILILHLKSLFGTN